MIKHKKLLVFLLFFPVFVQLALYGMDSNEELPIKIKFQNDSDHMVVVHVLSDTMIESSQYLGPGKRLEINVAFGNRIRMEYKPSPHQTVLSQMGSLNELNRTVLIMNDGKTLFIEEKFSGQRVKGKGIKRIPGPTISDPELERQKKRPADPGKSLNKKKKSNRKEDPNQPGKKKEKKKE